ncbi:MAG: glycosyltransferase family 2 protein [Oscillospiraceae bacterium]|nr:glycosyltransferase family 2 protein [Oscillospiraceae bacterium]
MAQKRAELKKREFTCRYDERLDKQERFIREQQMRIEQLKKENLHLRKSFETSYNLNCWKNTKPIRFTIDILKWLLRPHAEKHVLRKGLRSLRCYGLKETLQKGRYRASCSQSFTQLLRQKLFSEGELATQRSDCFPRAIRFSIAVPLYNTPEKLLRAMIESVLAQTYAIWELCMADGSDAAHVGVERVCREYAEKDKRIRYQKLEKNFGISANTNACLEMSTGDYIGLLDHDDLLHPAALHEVMRAICEKNADFVFTDESHFYELPEDVYLPHFKPVYAPDNLLSNNYICHFTIFKRTLLNEAGLFDSACDGSQDHDMVLRLTEKAERIAHIPEILYYWRAHRGSVAEDPGVKSYTVEAGVWAVQKSLARRGIEGKVEPVKPGMTYYRIRYAIKGMPRVSVLIPNYEHMEELKTCLDSVFKKTTWSNYEIVIVENNSTSPELFDYYEKLQKERKNVRVVVWQGRFNYSAVNNFGVSFCTGEYLLLLHNDTKVITPDWMQEMLMFAQREDVGAVGAKLYYPDGTIQHAGVGLGLGDMNIAGHMFCGVNGAVGGYMGRLLYAQDLSAVSAACMLLRRSVWDALGGLDEGYEQDYNDVDLCMRIRQAGRLVVWTPFAELIHVEAKSRGKEDSPEKQRRHTEESVKFRKRWQKELDAGDPYYNPNLTLDRTDFFAADTMRQHDAR